MIGFFFYQGTLITKLLSFTGLLINGSIAFLFPAILSFYIINYISEDDQLLLRTKSDEFKDQEITNREEADDVELTHLLPESKKNTDEELQLLEGRMLKKDIEDDDMIKNNSNKKFSRKNKKNKNFIFKYQSYISLFIIVIYFCIIFFYFFI